GGHPCCPLSADVELPPPGECNDAANDRVRLCCQGIQGPDYLHSRGAYGVKAMNDPIVEEVRRVRDAHAARFNYDLDAIFQDIKEQEIKSKHKFVASAARRSVPNNAP